MECTSNFDLASESGGSTPKQPFNWGGMWCATMVFWKLPVFRQAHVNLRNNGNWQYTVGYHSRLNSEERSWTFLGEEEAHCITMDDIIIIIIIIILRYPKSSHIGCLWASLHLKMLKTGVLMGATYRLDSSKMGHLPPLGWWNPPDFFWG